MKIALVIREFSLAKGGAERYAVNLSRELLKLGHQVHIFANSFLEANDPAAAGLLFHRVPIVNLTSAARDLSFASNFRKILQKEKFDIVNGLTRVYPVDVYRAGGGLHGEWLAARYPSGFRRHLAFLLDPVHLATLHLERQMLKPGNFRRIITNSKFWKSALETFGNVPAERIDVVYNGVNTSTFHPKVKELYRQETRRKLRLSDEARVILFSGNNFGPKGLGTLIKALSLLSEELADLYLLVLGRGRKEPFQRLAQKSALSHRVIFAGFAKEPERFYGASDLFVLPTRYDPFANVCLEALASGLPVITTTANGASEIIENGKNGFILEDVQDFKALAGLIRRFFLEADRQEFSSLAHEIASVFTVERNARQTLAVYEKALAEKGCQ